jgi:UDP-N-acetylmuramoyl-tripeptide--D-alanyl-D-alanine ligase
MKKHSNIDDSNNDIPEKEKSLWNSGSLSKALNRDLSEGIEISSVSIDTRSIGPESLFIGMKGEKLDGNDYVIQAFNSGALLCIIDKEIEGIDNFGKQIIKVPDSFEALYKLARYNRNRNKGKFIGVTGSVGKTSTKEMLSLAFSKQGNVYASYGNYNNHYGLPLCMSNMPKDSEFNIFEMGMSSKGEIQKLSKLCLPDIAIVTDIGPAHLEFFSSISGIASAKSEIYDGMSADGYAIINSDNPYSRILKDKALQKGMKIIEFAVDSKADCRLSEYSVRGDVSNVKAEIFGHNLEYEIGIIGKQHVINSLAVLAAVHASGAEVENAARQFRYLKAQKRRGEIFKNESKKITVIDDSYNASPLAVRYALENLKVFKKPGNRLVAVLGDMKELGSRASDFHTDLLPHILESRIDSVYTVGDLMLNLHRILPVDIRGKHADNSSEMANIIGKSLAPNDVVLIKGSFSMQMDVISSKLKT